MSTPPHSDVSRIMEKIKLNADYGYLPGGKSLDYFSSAIFPLYEDFPVQTVRPVQDHSFEYGYGVHLPRCKSQDMDQYFRWCYDIFGPTGFEMEAAARKFWFREERNRTMFMLKWGHR